jgi:trehalose-6-phosphate synthase
VGVMSNTLINVSNRLPVTVEGDKIAKSAGGLVAALDGLSKEQYTTKWIGWPGAAFAETSREREIEKLIHPTTILHAFSDRGHRRICSKTYAKGSGMIPAVGFRGRALSG